MPTDIYSSVTRIANFKGGTYEIKDRPREQWQRGDYVLGVVNERPSPRARVESASGRAIELLEGERLIGALGTRRATREIVGGWKDIEPDGTMDVIGGGGVIGKVTSISPFLTDPISLEYAGHVYQNNSPVGMTDFVDEVDVVPLEKPVIMITGTSMSAGKTTAGRVIVRTLKEEGYRVTAGKLAGSARYHDALSMRDAGADTIFDFVDVGLPTTVIDPESYRRRVRQLLSRMQYTPDDVLVVETGASPFEPYNGDVAIEELGDRIVFTVCCASDPYSVVGLMETLDVSMDLISGIATNTDAGIDLIRQLADLPALNLHMESAKEPLREHLVNALTN